MASCTHQSDVRAAPIAALAWRVRAPAAGPGDDDDDDETPIGDPDDDEGGDEDDDEDEEGDTLWAAGPRPVMR